MSALHWMTAEGDATVVFPFTTMDGALIPAQQNFEREVRPGVNGVGLWQTGSRGEPFTITTQLDCVSVSAASTAFAAYLAAVLTKKDLYYLGALWGTVLVEKVVFVSIKKFAAGVGGIQGHTGGDGAVLTVQWVLETLPS